MRPHMPLVLAALCAIVALPAPSRAVDVTTCGQVVPAGEAGVLAGDLDCSGAPAGSDGVTLGRGASLDLQGHTLVGPPWDNAAQNAAARCRFGNVRCSTGPRGTTCRYPKGACRVFSSVGTGTITGAAPGVYSHQHVTVENLDIQVMSTGIFQNAGKLVATNVAVTGFGNIFGTDLRLTNVSVSDSVDWGIDTRIGGKVRGSNVSVTNNTRGGIRAGKVALVGLTATGNGTPDQLGVGGGIYAERIQLTDSTVTGNLWGGELDLSSGKRPKLVNTICGTSRNFRAHSPSEETWGVCADD